MSVLYKSFSTKNWFEHGGSLEIYDREAIKEDLLNHIFTLRGTRLNMPTFGTRIPALVFEPGDLETISIIREDLMTVFNYDPRVKLLDLKVYMLPNDNAMIAEATITYLEINITDTLHIEIGSK